MPITIDGTTGILLTGNAGLVQQGNGQFTFQDVIDVNSGGTGANTLTGIVKSNGINPFTAGAINLASSEVSGVLNVASGGTGTNTLRGVIKGNGTNAFAVAVAGTDYVAPANTSNFTATQTFTGSSSSVAEILRNAAEVSNVSATAATGTVNLYPAVQSVLYYTTNAGANWTVNLTFSSTTTMDAALATGQCLTVAFLATQGATAYYNNVVQVDGTTAGVTTRWQGGAPTAGNASGIDAYTYTVIKTGSATFTVLASVVQFKA